MAISRQKKEEIVAKAKEIVASPSVVFVNFHGLNVTDTTQLRNALREQGVGYAVVKKTLARRALADSSAQGEIPALEGELALAYGDDLIAPARGVYGFQKDHMDSMQILGGIFEGKYMNKEEMLSIATIPPTPVLYGQFVNLINSPIQRFVVALNQIAEKRGA